MRTCRNCGQVTEMMCQQGTGFCSANCEDDYTTITDMMGVVYQRPMLLSDWVSA